jgi:hypothetical protein
VKREETIFSYALTPAFTDLKTRQQNIFPGKFFDAQKNNVAQIQVLIKCTGKHIISSLKDIHKIRHLSTMNNNMRLTISNTMSWTAFSQSILCGQLIYALNQPQYAVGFSLLKHSLFTKNEPLISQK